MTSCDGSSPVGWDGRGGGSRGGKERAPLGKRVLLNRRVPLGEKVVF